MSIKPPPPNVNPLPNVAGTKETAFDALGLLAPRVSRTFPSPRHQLTGPAIWTVKICALLVPTDVVTVTLRMPTTAVEPIVNVVVIDVGLTTVTGPTVTSVLLIATVAPAMKFVPVSVTGTVCP